MQTVTDYISGKQVRASAEEIEAVQVFARKLVDDLGYPKSHIQTRPQYKVRCTPSGGKAKGYPIDIAVFASSGWIAALEAFEPERRDAAADEAEPFIERIAFFTRDAEKPKDAEKKRKAG